ncbi:MAG: hypothetical protein L3J47_11585 [Sulfurovum sp.]|nr:hypothetical protein [Sulfurovum sp.]
MDLNKKFYVLIASLIMVSVLLAEETSNSNPNLLFEGGNEAILATRNNFYIDYSDEVTGGCLPKPARLKDKLELSLRRNHLEMSVKKDILGSTLKLSALGFKAGPNYCAVTLTLTLESWVGVKVPYAENNPDGDMTIVPMQFTIGQYLLTGKKGSMQRRLEKVAYELGDSLYLKIARSRDVIFEKFPAIASEYKEKKK